MKLGSINFDELEPHCDPEQYSRYPVLAHAVLLNDAKTCKTLDKRRQLARDAEPGYRLVGSFYCCLVGIVWMVLYSSK